MVQKPWYLKKPELFVLVVLVRQRNRRAIAKKTRGGEPNRSLTRSPLNPSGRCSIGVRQGQEIKPHVGKVFLSWFSDAPSLLLQFFLSNLSLNGEVAQVKALSGRGGGERCQSDSPQAKTVAGTREASVYGEAGRLPSRVVLSSAGRKDWIGSVHPNPPSQAAVRPAPFERLPLTYLSFLRSSFFPSNPLQGGLSSPF
jgi:hypothetical protein